MMSCIYVNNTQLIHACAMYMFYSGAANAIIFKFTLSVPLMKFSFTNVATSFKKLWHGPRSMGPARRPSCCLAVSYSTYT